MTTSPIVYLNQFIFGEELVCFTSKEGRCYSSSTEQVGQTGKLSLKTWNDILSKRQGEYQTGRSIIKQAWQQLSPSTLTLTQSRLGKGPNPNPNHHDVLRPKKMNRVVEVSKIKCSLFFFKMAESFLFPKVAWPVPFCDVYIWTFLFAFVFQLSPKEKHRSLDEACWWVFLLGNGGRRRFLFHQTVARRPLLPPHSFFNMTPIISVPSHFWISH